MITEPCFSGTEQVQPLAAEAQGQQKVLTGSKHKRILCFDSSGEGQPCPTSTSSSAANTSRPASAPHPQKDSVPVARTRPNILGGNKPKRRVQPVRCLKDPQAEDRNLEKAHKTTDAVKKLLHKQKLSTGAEETPGVGTGRTDSSQLRTGRQSDSERRRKSAAKEDPMSTPASSDSERNKDREAPGRVGSKPREGRLEKKAPVQEAPNVTGNKENEMKDGVQQKQEAASPAPQAGAESLPRTPKTPSKTSSLAKQATELLHNLQGHTPPSEPPGHTEDESSPLPRTPGRQKKGKDGEGTPKHLLPSPHTAEVPSCSPASEAGSEISASMAAHTLMILSRATMPRTGSPLKDSLRQDGVADKTPTSSKNLRKRKLSSPADTPPAKKDPRVSGTHVCPLYSPLTG